MAASDGPLAKDSTVELSRWTSAILLGCLVLFSIAKPRIQQRLDEIQQRTAFQNGFNPLSKDASERLDAVDPEIRRVGALGGIQLILLCAFLVSWFLALWHLRVHRQASELVDPG